MFNSDANAICLYQGQELGLKNPKNLSISDIFNLDSKTEFQHIKNKASIESLMQGSCANARVPIPLDEYAFQESNPESVLANAIALVQKWKHR
jgi:glycosidase